MEYVAPETLDDACVALALDGAHCLAGGQSLVAMMNLGLATPERLVSLRRIAALRGIETAADGGLRIGAMTTHAELAALADGTAAALLLAQTARVIAYPAVRNRGTIGGAVALADPAADYPVALVALNAILEIAFARGGTRAVPARDFFQGMFETSLAPGEIVAAVRLPGSRPGTGSTYEKLSVVAGDFAIVSVAAVVTIDENAPVNGGARDADIQVAVGGYAMKPILLSLGGCDNPVDAATQQLASHADPPGDHRASSAYRRRVTPALVERALAAARASARRQALHTRERR